VWWLPDGSLAWHSTDKDGRIFVLKWNELTDLPVPAEAKVAGLVTSVTRDSEDAWLFSTAIVGEGLTRTELIRFDGKTRMSFADRDDYASKMANKGASYRVGSPLNPWYPVFDDRGRSVSSHAGQFVKLFDGKTWQTSPQVPEKDLHGRHPFFRDGNVMVVGLQGTYVGVIDPDTGQWTWQTSASIPYPFPEQTRARMVDSVPSNDPMDGAFLGKPLQAGLLMFALGNEKLAIHDGRAWHALPTAPSPVAGWRAISSVIMTQPNQFILRTDQPSGQSAVLTLPSIRLTTTKPKLGSFDKPHAMARPEVESDVPADARALFYRVDLGKWEPLTADGHANLGIRSRGIHRLTVCAVGKEKLSVSGHLTFEFETTYDLEEYIGPTIRQLGAEEHATREAATKTLIDCGEAVVPLMERLLNHDDPEVVMRAKRIIDAVTQSTP
jgi:hypothetical protein